MTDISYIHHSGLVVHDMEHALEVCRRLGFLVEPPSYGTLPVEDGEPKPFGAANAHVRFGRNFLEVVAIVGENSVVPAGAQLVPLQVPAEHLPAVTTLIQRTVDRFAARLDRFEGLHRVVFASTDVEAVAGRLAERGIPNSGVNVTQRPVETEEGAEVETIRHIELSDVDDASDPPEGILAIAEAQSADHSSTAEHPNGAIALTDVVMCVADEELADVRSRYEGYLDRAATLGGETIQFDLDGTRLTIVTERHLDGILPGEKPPAVPAYLAVGIAVRDLGRTERLLIANGLTPTRLPTDEVLVSATEALGTAVLFHQGGER